MKNKLYSIIIYTIVTATSCGARSDLNDYNVIDAGNDTQTNCIPDSICDSIECGIVINNCGAKIDCGSSKCDKPYYSGCGGPSYKNNQKYDQGIKNVCGGGCGVIENDLNNIISCKDPNYPYLWNCLVPESESFMNGCVATNGENVTNYWCCNSNSN